MNKFALDSVMELIEDEMGKLEDELSSPQSDLSEETLLSIKWKDLMASIQHKAPHYMGFVSACCIYTETRVQEYHKEP